MSDRRAYIDVEIVSPHSKSMTQFHPYFVASVSIKHDGGSDERVVAGCSNDTNLIKAIHRAVDNLEVVCVETAPNGELCHQRAACTLAGTCLKQQGGGTACNE